MKSYSYKSPNIILILAIGLLFCSSFFVRMVFISDIDLWIRLICLFFFVLFFAFGVVIGFVFIRNIKPKKIILDENKILIPDIFITNKSAFYYSSINEIKIAKYYNTIFSPYGGAICIATKKNGYTREVFIEKIWMKNKADYLELFYFLNQKIKK